MRFMKVVLGMAVGVMLLTTGPVTSEPGSPGPYFWAITFAAYDYWDGHRWYHTDRRELGRDMPSPNGAVQVPTSYSKTFNNV